MSLEVLPPLQHIFSKKLQRSDVFPLNAWQCQKLYGSSISLTCPLLLTALGYQVRSRWEKSQCSRISKTAPIFSLPFNGEAVVEYCPTPVPAWGWSSSSIIHTSCFYLFPWHCSWLSPCMDYPIFLIGIWTSMKALRLFVIVQLVCPSGARLSIPIPAS